MLIFNDLALIESWLKMKDELTSTIIDKKHVNITCARTDVTWNNFHIASLVWDNKQYRLPLSPERITLEIEDYVKKPSEIFRHEFMDEMCLPSFQIVPYVGRRFFFVFFFFLCSEIAMRNTENLFICTYTRLWM